MKVCSTCQESKDESLFYKNRALPGGLSNVCKTCQNGYNKRYASKNPEVIADVKYNYQSKNLHKHSAQQAVGRAIKEGKLVRPAKCQRCAREVFTEAHHSDYSKPLEVEWLCKSCHVNHHLLGRLEPCT